MKTHELKTWPQFFEAAQSGEKNFEVRLNDRDFQRGDLLLLREWCPRRESFTGREATRKVTYILNGGQFGVEEGYCVMGMEYHLSL